MSEEWLMVCRKHGHVIDRKPREEMLRGIYEVPDVLIPLEDEPQWCDECGDWRHVDVLKVTIIASTESITLPVDWMQCVEEEE